MSINPPIADVIAMIRQRQQRAIVRVAENMHTSIVWGSPLTGAPGQPVDTGDLKRSWQLTFPEQWRARSASGIEYAPKIEYGVGPHGKLTLRSSVGGFHSRDLTRAGFGRLVDQAIAEVVAGKAPSAPGSGP